MDTTVDRLIEYFVLTKQVEGKSAKTVEWYTGMLGQFYKFLSSDGHSTCIHDLMLEDGRDFIAFLQGRTKRFENHPYAPPQEGGLSVHTIRCHVRALKSFGTWLAEEGYTETSLFERLVLPKAPKNLDGPAAFACAQSGCQICLDTLTRRHEGLVHAVLRRQARGDVAYEDLLQEGRIGLWQAVLHFDPHRGVAFSTYAGVAIERRTWRLVTRANRPQGVLPLPDPTDSRQVAEENLWWSEVCVALREAVFRLPERLCQVIVAAYGLDGQLPRTLTAIGQQFDVSREMARIWRNDSLLLLRLPAFSGRLRHL